MKGQAKELKRLCTFERDRGDTEIRWSFDEYSDGDKSSKYISGRRWFKGTDGGWHPTKAGLTIRLSELDELVSQLQRVQRARDSHGEGRKPTHTERYVDERQSQLVAKSGEEIF